MPTAVPAVPEKAGSSDRMTAVLALGAILLLGGAGAFVLVKYRRNSARPVCQHSTARHAAIRKEGNLFRIHGAD